MTDASDTQYRLRRLEWSIRALAQAAEVQRALLPGFVVVPDELALEFDEHLSFFGPGLDEVLDAGVVRLIRDLDARIAALSGSANLAFWQDEALDSRPEWNELRAMAKRVVAAAGWDDTPPPADRDLYVGPDA